MEYNDYDLSIQRKVINHVIDGIYNDIINMYNNKNYDFIHIYKDVEGLDYIHMCFGNIFFELYNKKYCNSSFGSFDFRKDNNGDTCYQVSFAILDDSIDLNDPKQILELYIRILTKHRIALFHEFVHCNDAFCGYITKDMTSKSDNIKDYVNNKMEYHAYLQELLQTAEEDMIINNWNRMNIPQRINLKKAYIANRKKERNKGNSYVRHFTKEHYDEMIEHAKYLFDMYMYTY